MLDIDTKRHIDTARDILVGKVPDPKSQVEQITIALIYKFMNDIDAESEALGGERTFFTGEFDKYRWANLVHSGLGGAEMLDLYVEALIRIPENPNIPPLFREIFNNVYLPFRDAETLRMFFNVIGEFTYDHSERLGDAFEHLLSVMGSQGDAGQFRTPRHIIDFMVKIIDPQKHETSVGPGMRHGRISRVVVQAHSVAKLGRKRQKRAHARRAQQGGEQPHGLRHIARHGAVVARQPLSARLPAAEHPRVRHADQRRATGTSTRM